LRKRKRKRGNKWGGRGENYEGEFQVGRQRGRCRKEDISGEDTMTALN
jgi:hypothetical protein